MTLDELEKLVSDARDVAATERLAGILAQVVEFIGKAPFRTLTNAGVTDQSMRDLQVAEAIRAHLESVVLYAASVDLVGRCPYGHAVSNEPGGCLPGSCGWR